MEVMDTATNPTAVEVPLNLWCILGKEGSKKVTAEMKLEEKTLKALKEFVCNTLEGSVVPNEIEILYSGGAINDDKAVESAVFKPMNILTVIKLNGSKKEDEIGGATGGLSAQVTQIALALRTAFLNPKFVTMIMKIGQSETLLENILAIAPGLKNDPIGIAVIQDPSMIFHLSDVESLKKLATTKPWILEAFNYLAASIHQESGQTAGSLRNDAASGLFNVSMFGEDEDMDDDESFEAEPTAGSLGRITREQLSAALNSLNSIAGRAAIISQNNPRAGIPQSTQHGATTNTSSGSAAAVTPDFNRLLANALQTLNAPAGSNPGLTMPPALTPDLVSRAMSTALNSLPQNEREGQLNILREQIARIQGGNASLPNTSTASAPNPTTLQSPQPYANELRQMRDMGMTDERLCLLALRVSDGDVQTSLELLFSGWTGEGADVEMPDEE